MFRYHIMSFYSYLVNNSSQQLLKLLLCHFSLQFAEFWGHHFFRKFKLGFGAAGAAVVGGVHGGKGMNGKNGMNGRDGTKEGNVMILERSFAYRNLLFFAPGLIFFRSENRINIALLVGQCLLIDRPYFGV